MIISSPSDLEIPTILYSVREYHDMVALLFPIITRKSNDSQSRYLSLPLLGSSRWKNIKAA